MEANWKNGNKKKSTREEEEDEEEFRSQHLHEDSEVPEVFVTLLKLCAIRKNLAKGTRIHDFISKKELLRKNTSVGNSLVNMYAKCNALIKAEEVFDELPYHTVVSWNALLSGYSQHGRGEELLLRFDLMKLQGIPPNPITFVCALKACGNIEAIVKGKQIHAQIVSEGLLGENMIVGNALVDMYAKCGELVRAKGVFDELPARDVVSWTALISGYAQQGRSEEALECIKEMQYRSFAPDFVTFICILKACSSIGAVAKGEEIHAQIVKEGLIGKSRALGNALIDMYFKCGSLVKAQEVFHEIPVQDVISWTTLISGYVRHGHGEQAIKGFERMQIEAILADAVMFVYVLKACGIMGMIVKGQQIHTQIITEGWLERNIIVGNALVDMYAKCGALVKAQNVFDTLPFRDVVSWNALISGYAQLGRDEIVFDLFDKMLDEKKEPNLVTFTTVLNACSHGGLLDEGHMYFEAMGQSFGIVPTVEHCACMIDLFGRAGNFDDAITVIGKMPTSDYLPLWIALLGACTKWGNLDLGGQAFEHVVGLNGKCSPAHASMRNIYAITLMREE